MIFHSTQLGQAFALAGSLSLLSRDAFAQPHNPAATDNPEGQAGIATLCLEKRSYVDPTTGSIVTPRIYIEEMPREGIDTLYFEGSPAEVKWKELLNPSDPKKKAWIEETNIPEQAQDAFDLMKKLDKDKNGIVTYEEFEKGEKGASAEDKKNSLSFLTSLRCSGQFLTQGALNKVDVDKFPEVITLRKNLTATYAKADDFQQQLSQAKEDFSKAQRKSKIFLGVGTGAGLGGAALGFGLGFLFARRKPSSGPRPLPEKPANPPEPAKGEQAKPDNEVKDGIDAGTQALLDALNEETDEPDAVDADPAPAQP